MIKLKFLLGNLFPRPLRPLESRDSAPAGRKVILGVCARDLFEEESRSASRIVNSLRWGKCGSIISKPFCQWLIPFGSKSAILFQSFKELFRIGKLRQALHDFRLPFICFCICNKANKSCRLVSCHSLSMICSSTKWCSVVSAATSEIRTVCNTRGYRRTRACKLQICANILIICRHLKCLSCSSGISLVLGIKSKNKCRFRAVVRLFYIWWRRVNNLGVLIRFATGARNFSFVPNALFVLGCFLLYFSTFYQLRYITVSYLFLFVAYYISRHFINYIT
jgi:hypothetical protein